MRTRTLAIAPRTSAMLQFTPTSASIALPENLLEASETQIKTVVGEALAALKPFKTMANVGVEELAEARRLAQVVKDGRSELAARAERSAELAELTDLEDEPAAEAPAAPAVEEPKVEEPKVEAAVEAPKASEVKAAGGGDEAPAVEVKRAEMAAAPDAVGVAQGHVFADFAEAAQSVLSRTSGYPVGATATPARFQHGAVAIRRQFDPSLVAAGYEDNQVLDRAASFDRIGGEQALLASGGWVSASETVYDLLEYEGVDGMIDVPEVQIVRGGLRFTKGPAYSAFRGQGFVQSEAQAIAGTAKTFYRVPGTNFQEVRAGVVGLGVTAGILVQKAYPELVERVLRGLLVAHTHDINRQTISNLAAGSTAATVDLGKGALTKLLSSIELQAMDIRYTYGMTDDAVLECVLPTWSVSLLRQDLAYRLNARPDRISTAEITQHFADRGVRVQWVKDWQDAWIGQSGSIATAWPTSLQYLIYPAGTWVRGMGDVITINTLYDSVGLGNNDYTALFTEESFLTVMRGYESRQVTVPVVPDGSSSSTWITHNV